jgi:TolB-like protein
VVHLPPKELAALRLLLENAGQVVSPSQLKQVLWGDVHVTADSVLKCMSSLRARLATESCIQTVYKRGYRFAAEVLWHSGSSAAILPRMAILPFATAYAVPEHLGHAIAEETMTRLSNARNPAVSVLARDSVFALAGRGLTAEQIGKALKADLVLTGTLSAFSSQFRLRAEMIRVEDGVQIWVEDLLVDQDRLAGVESELVERLDFRLAPEVPGDRSSSTGWSSAVPGDRASSTGQNNLLSQLSAAADDEADRDRRNLQREAFDIFLRGHYEWQTLHRHQMQDGLQHLLRAIELDPSLVSAKVDLAHLCVMQAFYGYLSPAVAADHVHRIEESIPDLPQRAPELLPALGWINFHFDRNLPAAIQAFSSSSHLPHDPWITRARSMFTLSRRRFPEAIALLRAAIQEDPFSPWLQSRLAWALHLNGQAAESVNQIQSALNILSEHEFTKFYGALILAYNGDSASALQLAADLVQRLPFFDPAIAVHAYVLACAGRKDEARAILERLQWLSRERFLLNSFNPAVHVALGDHDAAIDELRAADESRCPWFFQMLADPRLKPLHGHPEFQKMHAILTAMEA